MGSVYWGLPGIMKLDPAGQELWHSGGVKAEGTPNPGLSEGGVRTYVHSSSLHPQSWFLFFTCTYGNERRGRARYEGLTPKGT